ncbi:hypothetical protein F4604DRAFT_1709390 [Suillus subluteus]|nr:hypothetical protein F4604DRAFT_1709390 [Suillus subluteus]
MLSLLPSRWLSSLLTPMGTHISMHFTIGIPTSIILPYLPLLTHDLFSALEVSRVSSLLLLLVFSVVHRLYCI